MASKYGYMAKIGADTSGLQAGLKNINSSLRATDSELYKVNRSIKSAAQAGTDSSAMLKQKEDILNEAISETSQKLEQLRSVEEQVRNAANSGNITAENYRDYQREVANTEAQLRQYQNQLISVQQEEQNSAGANQVVVTSLADVQSAYQRVAADIKEFTDSLKWAADKAVSFSKDAVQYSLNVGRSFESSMSQVKAYSGAVGEDFDRLESAAKGAGATTSKSATEAADALGYMALAGWDTEEMLEGLMPIVRASEAGSADLKRTSDLVTDSMSAMGVATSDLSRYLDICTAAQSNSNTTLTALLEAYVGCGGTLRNLNVPLEESAALLGILANRGIKASEAGTSLNSILVNLMGANKSAKAAMDSLNISAWDAEGNFIGVTNTLKLLDGALENCTEQQKNFLEAKIGGKTQMDTLQALIAGVREEYGELYTTLENSQGALETTAETMHDNLAGALTTMHSALEALGNEFYDYLEQPAKEAVNAVTDAIRKLTKSVDAGELSAHLKTLSEKLAELIEKLAKFAAEKGIDMLIDGLSKLVDMLSWCADHFDQLVIAAEGLGAAFVGIKISKLVIDVSVLIGVIQTLSAVAGEATVASKALSAAMSAIPAVAIGLAISALAIGISEYTVSVYQAEARTAELRNEVDKAGTSLTDTVVAINKMRESVEDAEKETENSIAVADRALDSLDDLVDENGNLKDAQANVDEQLKILNETFELNLEVVNGQIQGYKELKGSYEEYCQSLRDNARLEAMRPTYIRSVERLDKIDEEISDLNSKKYKLQADYEQVIDNPNTFGLYDKEQYEKTDEFKLWQSTLTPWERRLRKDDIINNNDNLAEFLKWNAERTGQQISEAEAEKRQLENNRDEYEKLAFGTDEDNKTYITGDTVANEQSRIGKAQSDELNERAKERREEILSKLTDLDGQLTVGDIDEESYYKAVGDIVNNEGYRELFHDDKGSDFWKYYSNYSRYAERQNKAGGGSSGGKKTAKQTDPEQKAEQKASAAVNKKKKELTTKDKLDDNYDKADFYNDLEAFAENELDHETEAYTDVMNEIAVGRKELLDKETEDKKKSAEQSVKDKIADKKETLQELVDSGDMTELQMWQELEDYINNGANWTELEKLTDEFTKSGKDIGKNKKKAEGKEKKKQQEKDKDAAKEELEALTEKYTDLLISEEEFQKELSALKEKYAEKNVDIAEMYAEKEIDIEKKRAENEEKLIKEYTSGKLYSDVTEKGGKNRKVFDDLSKRTEEIKKYAADYAKLSQMKDVPPDLLEEIRSMDFDERRAVVAELMAMNEQNRSAYFADYTAYRNAARSAAEAETGVKFDADGFYGDSTGNAEMHGEADGQAYAIGFLRGMEKYSPEIDYSVLQNRHTMSDLPGGHDPHGGFISPNTPINIIIAGIPVIESTVGKILTDNGLSGRNGLR